jgi:acyl-CoA hydrolase
MWRRSFAAQRALFVGSNMRDAVNAGRPDFVPVFQSDIPQLFTRTFCRLDVALVHVSPWVMSTVSKPDCEATGGRRLHQ